MSTSIERVDPFKEMFPIDPPAIRKIFAVDGDQECWSSSSTSSIGRNSDDDGDEKSSDGGENEVESSYKEGPLDMMESLEEVLPIRRGISKFYNGKSKSFTSLNQTASCSSIKDITKPENAYSRRRRNLASHNLLDKTRCGISKRGIRSSKSNLALAMAMNDNKSGGSSASISSSSSCGSWSCEDCLSPKSGMLLMLPPVHPQTKGHYGNHTWRSYSVADLARCSGVVAGGGAKISGHGV